MLAELLAGSGMIVDLLLRHDESSNFWSPGVALMLSGHLLAGLLLLFGRERLAAFLVPDEELDLPAAKVLLDVGFRLCGVLVIARGVERLGWNLASRKAAEFSEAIPSALLEGALLVLFGLGLMLGAGPLVRLLQRARAAGHPPAD